MATTLDTYGHLMPGAAEEAAELLDAYMKADRQRAQVAARAVSANIGTV